MRRPLSIVAALLALAHLSGCGTTGAFAGLGASQGRIKAASTAPAKLAFPNDFLWGAATAAHQVEGNLKNDWTEWEAKPGYFHNGDTSQVGVDHYNRFDEDFGLAAGMGHNVHRMSVEWSRIEPQPGQWDRKEVEHYHAVFRSLKRHGLKPMVTLHHFTSPQWIAAQGGWLSDKTIQDFARFASFMAIEYGGEVDMWVTINEPNVYAFNAYESGVWPPMVKGKREQALLAMANLARGHARAYHALHAGDRIDTDGDGTVASVGIAHHIALQEALRKWHPLDQAAAYLNDKVFNRAFLKAVTTGELAFTVPGTKGVTGKEPLGKNAIDFIGINYYTRWRTKGLNDRLATPDKPLNDLNWEIYPEGIYKSLKLANDYAKLPNGNRVPVYITENGMDDRDAKDRNKYLVSHLKQVHRAIKDGVNVRGYIHWTLMDNFEWVEGYAPQFGLFTIDRSPGGNLARRPTETVGVYKEITAANGLTENLLEKYGQ